MCKFCHEPWRCALQFTDDQDDHASYMFLCSEKDFYRLLLWPTFMHDPKFCGPWKWFRCIWYECLALVRTVGFISQVETFAQLTMGTPLQGWQPPPYSGDTPTLIPIVTQKVPIVSSALFLLHTETSIGGHDKRQGVPLRAFDRRVRPPGQGRPRKV